MIKNWVYSAVISSLALAPSSRAVDLLLTDDTMTIGTTATTNYGTGVFFSVVTTGPRKSFVKFDLTQSLPAGTTANDIKKAIFRLYVTGITAGGTVSAVEVTGPMAGGGEWTEDTLKHSTLPPVGTATADNTKTLATTDLGTFQQWDVTGLVQDWLDGTLVNRGIALLPGGAINVNFDSKEATTTSHQPTLELILNGPPGQNGTPGTNGTAATVSVGTVSTLPAGSPATVVNSGTSSAANFNFGIPAGANGINGTNGTAATISIGTVTGLAAGAAPTVVNAGGLGNALLNFGIPAGPAGPTAERVGEHGDLSMGQFKSPPFP